MKYSKRMIGHYAKVLEICRGERSMDEIDKHLKPIFEQADIDHLLADGSTLMLEALKAGNEAIVPELLRIGAGPNRRGLNQELALPLMVAAQKGLLDAAVALIEKGANVDLLTDDGRTVAEVAEQGEHPEHAPTFARWMEEFTLKDIEL